MNEASFRGKAPRRLKVWRLVAAVCLAAWFIKLDPQFGLFFQGPEHVILSHSLIPAWLCRPDVGAVLYFAPAGFLPPVLWCQKVVFLRTAAVLYGVCSLLMLWHVQSYNDATYVTGFWTSLWLLWWAGQTTRTDASRWHGITLAMGIVSLCFLGGAVGKLSALSWDGEAVHHLYFLDKDYFPFTWLRANLAPETVKTLAAVFARLVIASECLLATCILWPCRLAVAGVLLVLTFMLVISQIQLFSVVGPLMGLALACAWLMKEKDGGVQQDLEKPPLPSSLS